jgi:hypothetical protein
MKIYVQVISERDSSYQSKRGGKVEQVLIACLDLCPVSPMLNTFDYVLSDDERERLRGTLRGKKLELAVEDAKPDFGGRLRFRGRILDKAETMKS